MRKLADELVVEVMSTISPTAAAVNLATAKLLLVNSSGFLGGGRGAASYSACDKNVDLRSLIVLGEGPFCFLSGEEFGQVIQVRLGHVA